MKITEIAEYLDKVGLQYLAQSGWTESQRCGPFSIWLSMMINSGYAQTARKICSRNSLQILMLIFVVPVLWKTKLTPPGSV